MSEENEIQRIESPSDIVREAIKSGADLDKLEKLLTLQERWDANQAKKVFANAFALAQSKIVGVVKTKLNPQTHSKYAGLEDIILSAQPIYTTEGFSVIFYEGDAPSTSVVRIYADVLHSAGHKETYHYDVPFDGVGIKGSVFMTPIHAKASATSYGRRYLLCMIWNIPTQDNDGNSVVAETEYIDDSQLKRIKENLTALNIDLPAFLKYMELESLEKMPKTMFRKAVVMIEEKRKAGKK